jgi:simple sugar transport system ATP-binding protein
MPYLPSKYIDQEQGMDENFLEIQHLSKTFNKVNALIDFNFSIRTGEIHCLVGENGCGKSTLIKSITGVEKPDQNESTSTPTESMHSGIQVIYQDLSLFPNLSVAENIEINSRIESHSIMVRWNTIRENAKRAIELIHTEIDIGKKVSELSMAQQQLVAIARAMTNNVKLLIMDEPTASLGRKDVENLIKIIKNLKKQGIAVLFVGHKLDEVLSMADRISVMRDGRLIKTFESAEQVTPRTLIPLMTKHQVNDERTLPARKREKAILEVKNLSKRDQFSDISFSLYPGEVLGVIGLVGSGRTELFSSIFGLNSYDSGEIIMDGRSVSIGSVSDAMDLGIGFVPENRLIEGLFMSKSIEQNINVTTLSEHLTRTKLLDRKRLENHAEDWIDTLKIKTPTGKNPANSLSGGNQQRIVLAKWMAIHPKILILDGPTIGIDVGAKSDIHQLIYNLTQEKGLGIIMITDEIAEAYQYSSRILIMRDGKIVQEVAGEGTTEQEIQKIVEGQTA